MAAEQVPRSHDHMLDEGVGMDTVAGAIAHHLLTLGEEDDTH